MSTTDSSLGKSLAEIMAIRREKLAKIRAFGYQPFAYKFSCTHSSRSVLDNYDALAEKVEIRIAGRLMSMRRMGRASFGHIQDEEGRIQVYIQENSIGAQAYQLWGLLDIGDIIGVRGKVFKTRTGEITILAEDLVLLAKNLRPIPIVKEKDGLVFDAFNDKEQRYRQRYLDLIVNPEVRRVFQIRSRIIQLTRQFLDTRGFLEVETPVLQPIYGGAFARPFKTHYHALDRDFYLRIADELYLKRLIIGGFERVYEIAKNFRNEGIDRSHNPEFTALEFYQAYADYYDMMDLVEEYFRFIAQELQAVEIEYEGHHIDWRQPFARLSMFDLLREYVGVDVRQLNESDLKRLCTERHLEIKPNSGYGKLIELLFDNFVEEHLIQPTFVIDYPKAISPLAKNKRDGQSEIVERFELYVAGREFANAFSELNDPIDQRERLEAQALLRAGGDEEAQTMDEDFVTAMEYGMPPTGGVGIGIDRVVMLFTQQSSIKDVILFPQLRT